MHKKKDKPVEDAQAEAKPEKNELDELREAVQKLQQERDELFGKLQRLSADYTNFQKRVPKQIADSVAYEKERIVRSILPVLDNFESALGGLKDAQRLEETDSVIKGVQIVHDQMLDVLRSYGVEQIRAVGERFEPGLHEAMMQRSEQGKGSDIVLEELQKGYVLNGRTIRPSKVIVNKMELEKKLEQHEEPAEMKTAVREGHETGAQGESETNKGSDTQKVE
jgi:molecular chaperone GrpE